MNLRLVQVVRICGVSFFSILSSYEVHAQNNWNFTMKNAFVDRDYNNDNVKDIGSWSQSASLFYKSNMTDTPIEINDEKIKIGLDASLQYAVRLSKDKGVPDNALPFDAINQEQYPDFLKKGATLKLVYKDTNINLGELYLNLPITSIDPSRQLLNSYWGANLKSKINNSTSLEIGRVEKVSLRYSEDFEDFTFTSNGKKKASSGLNYFDIRHKINDKNNIEYYYGNLEKLYDVHYLGYENTTKVNNYSFVTKLKYFNSKNNADDVKVNADNIGVLETVKFKNHSLGLGYQHVTGDSLYPRPDGFLPEVYFINWNTTGFFKEDEKSYHLIYGYDFKDSVPGFSSLVKFAYGHGFKDAAGRNNTEKELNLILDYKVQNPKLKGVSLRYTLIDYNIDYGNDFLENRFFVNYSKSF